MIRKNGNTVRIIGKTATVRQETFLIAYCYQSANQGRAYEPRYLLNITNIVRRNKAVILGAFN